MFLFAEMSKPESAWQLLERMGRELWVFLIAYLSIILIGTLVLFLVLGTRPWNFRLHWLGKVRSFPDRWGIPEVLIIFFFEFFLLFVIGQIPGLHYQQNKQDAAQHAALNGLWSLVENGGGLPRIPTQVFELDGIFQSTTSAFRNYHLTMVAAFPLFVMGYYLLMKRIANAEPFQMGLHGNRWRENITAGFLLYIVLMPIIIALLQFVALPFWTKLWGPPTRHGLDTALRMAMDHPLTLCLVMFTPLIRAPFLEEWFTRGMLQPVLVKRPYLADGFLVIALILAVVLIALRTDLPDIGLGYGPVLFVIMAAFGYWAFEKMTEKWITEPGAARGIFVSSLFFAALHFSVWPSPIPLFILALGLGLLSYRSNSIIGCITCHFLFNMTGILQLFIAKWLYPNPLTHAMQ